VGHFSSVGQAEIFQWARILKESALTIIVKIGSFR